MMNNGGATHEDRSRRCFQEWVQVQSEDLAQLFESLHRSNEEIAADGSIDNCIAHYKDYIAKRALLAEEGVSTFFAPTWCSYLENSMMWMAGSRPSAFTCMIYTLAGCEVDMSLEEWLEGIRPSRGRLGDLSLLQMEQVNELHIKTIEAEDRLMEEMASMQEEMADQPIAVIVTEMEAIGERNQTAEAALTKYEGMMKKIMAAADELRVNTMEEVIEILQPKQAVEFLAASNKFHLSLHLWGQIQ